MCFCALSELIAAACFLLRKAERLLSLRFKCAEMAFENWSGHSSTEVTGPLNYSGKLVMDLNYCYYHFFLTNSLLIFLFFSILWPLPAGSLAEIKADARMNKHGLSFSSARCGSDGAAQRESHGEPAAFETCEVSWQQLCSLAA